ncbi:MAG: zinc ribbon domain-containing protein [Candidatus Bathyarchaeota archaeon]|nr:zinc ribbon domain-containing protein [Candidatus Bathyarchaeota archaeon]
MYCSQCGKELSGDAYFCPKCGAKTREGEKAGISTPWKDMKESFYRLGEELEKAFTVAGTEMEKAFQKARDRVREATRSEPALCPHCKAENSRDGRYCYKCGQEM